MSTSTITNWTTADLGDLTGKRYFITGGNSGIGFEAATHLRRAGGDVIIASRSTSKGAAAVAELGKVTGDGAVDQVELDLASTASIRAASETLHGMVDGLDAVVNNAGIMQTPQSSTEDGFELQFGTNHLGHFLLDHLLFDLVEARSGRIVAVSSIAHRTGSLDFDDPMLTNSYSPTKAYSQSKLANIVFGMELARRLEAAGSPVIAVTTHPGYSATNLQSTGPRGILLPIYKFTNRFLAMDPADGALSEVLAAAGDEARNGAYYGPTKFGDSRGPTGESKVSDAAKDPENGRRLWELSEELLGIEWSIG